MEEIGAENCKGRYEKENSLSSSLGVQIRDFDSTYDGVKEL